MSSTSSNVLKDVGDNLLVKTARIIVEGPLYGVYLILMYLFIKIYAGRRIQHKRSIFLAAVAILLFLGCTCFFAMDIADLIIRIRVILMKQGADLTAEELEARFARADELTVSLMWTGTVMFIFALSIGDSILVWRTWALYRDQIYYIVLPCATLLGSFGAAFFELGCLIKTNWSLDFMSPNAGSAGVDACKKADKISYTLSFVTNIICTGLIIWKAWQHRRFMNKRLGQNRRRTPVDRVLTLFCESGALYLILYVLQSIPIYNTNLSTNTLIAMNIFNAVIQQAMGMYPTVIVVICQLQKSLWDSFDVPSEAATSTYILEVHSYPNTREGSRGKRISPLKFAPPASSTSESKDYGEVHALPKGQKTLDSRWSGENQRQEPSGNSEDGGNHRTETAGRHIRRKEKKIGEVGYFDIV